jgi:crossover junction endodeoxyribonuclease RusA
MINLTLPYPPSGNHMWKKGVDRTYLTDRAKDYYREIWAAAVQQGAIINIDQQVAVECRLYPPDKRRRDLDNAWKVLSDGLTKARVWQDDHLVRSLHLVWMDVEPGGRVELTIAPHGERIAS